MDGNQIAAMIEESRIVSCGIGRFKCGHLQDIRALSGQEVRYIADIMANFECFQCVAQKILKLLELNDCPHERLNEDGICRSCGADRRGI